LKTIFFTIDFSRGGGAKLRGKTLRQRNDELIAIAHPDHRAELRKEARRLYSKA